MSTSTTATRTYDYLLEAVSPIAHGDTSDVGAGTNTRLFLRAGNIVNGVPVRTPTLSENALRTVLFRRPLHDHLLTTLGIPRGSLARNLVNLLFAGGDRAAGAKELAGANRIGHAVATLYPALALLGGAVDAMVLPPGALAVNCWPLAREYASQLELLGRDDLVEEAIDTSIWDLLFTETRTRGTGAEAEGNQMLYTYETLAAGSRFLVRLTLAPHQPAAVYAAVPAALAAWDGFFGGQRRQGRGLLVVKESPDIDATPYRDHLALHATALRAGLLDATLGSGVVLCKE